MSQLLSGLVCGFTRSLPEGFAVSLNVFVLKNAYVNDGRMNFIHQRVHVTFCSSKRQDFIISSLKT